MKRIYIIATAIVFALTILIIVSINLYEEYSFNGVEEIYTIKTNYAYNTQEDDTLEVLCYSNNPKSFLKDYNDVQASLTSGNYILAATVEEVKRVSTHYYNEQRVYGYKLYVKPENVNINDGLQNCIMTTRDFEVEIGNVSIASLKDKSSYLDFSKIYAIGNESLGYKSINGFVITFTNKSSTPIAITEMFLGYFNNVDLSKAYKLDSDINYGDEITNYIPSYNPTSYQNSSGTIVIPEKSSVKYLIPVYYSSKCFLGNTYMYINSSLYIDNSNYLTNYDDLDSYKGIIKNAKINNS